MTRPLRIGIFVIQFPQLSETFIVTKVLKLLESGFDVRIFSLVESPHWEAFDVLRDRSDIRARVFVAPPLSPLPRVVTAGTVDLVRTALRSPRAFARYAAFTIRHRNETTQGVFKALYQRLRFAEHELDILHIEFDAQGIGIADLKEFLRCHVLYSVRGTFQRLSISRAIPDAQAYLFRYADGYHFISKALDRNTRALGLPPEIPTWHIEPAIDLTLFTPPRERIRPAGAPLRVISVGRVAWEKGYEFALDAVARAREAGVDLEYTIYGSGPFQDAVSFAIHQLGLEHCARLAGSIQRERMPQVYAEADLVIHAALDEGFCNAVIEAQAMKLPVVTTDAGGLPENVANGETGFVVPSRDADAMAEKIIELARSPELRAELGEAGRARVLQRFDLNAQAEAFVALYRDLASRPIRPIAREQT